MSLKFRSFTTTLRVGWAFIYITFLASCNRRHNDTDASEHSSPIVEGVAKQEAETKQKPWGAATDKFNLGLSYLLGTGVEKNLEEARKLFTALEETGFEEGKVGLLMYRLQINLDSQRTSVGIQSLLQSTKRSNDLGIPNLINITLSVVENYFNVKKPNQNKWTSAFEKGQGWVDRFESELKLTQFQRAAAEKRWEDAFPGSPEGVILKILHTKEKNQRKDRLKNASTKFSEELCIDAVQLRQDLSFYDGVKLLTNELREEVNKQLSKNTTREWDDIDNRLGILRNAVNTSRFNYIDTVYVRPYIYKALSLEHLALLNANGFVIQYILDRTQEQKDNLKNALDCLEALDADLVRDCTRDTQHLYIEVLGNLKSFYSEKELEHLKEIHKVFGSPTNDQGFTKTPQLWIDR